MITQVDLYMGPTLLHMGMLEETSELQIFHNVIQYFKIDNGLSDGWQ